MRRVTFINDWRAILGRNRDLMGWSFTPLMVSYIWLPDDAAQIGDTNINGLTVIVLGLGIRIRL